jgi:hypothetical protein
VQEVSENLNCGGYCLKKSLEITCKDNRAQLVVLLFKLIGANH